MYRIIKTDGTELGTAESVLYIKVSGNGTYIPTTKDEAVGVAFQSVAYNLFGHEEIHGDTVLVSEFDGGTQMDSQQASIDGMLLTMLEG